MARPDDRVVRKGKQYVANRAEQSREISAGQIGAPDRSGKERVADEQGDVVVIVPVHGKADATRTMTWRMKHAYLVPAESQNGVGLVKAIDGRLDRLVEP